GDGAFGRRGTRAAGAHRALLVPLRAGAGVTPGEIAKPADMHMDVYRIDVYAGRRAAMLYAGDFHLGNWLEHRKRDVLDLQVVEVKTLVEERAGFIRGKVSEERLPGERLGVQREALRRGWQHQAVRFDQHIGLPFSIGDDASAQRKPLDAHVFGEI